MLSGPRLPRRRKIIVAVVDNGKGITANRLEEIRERFNQTEIDTEQSIGLRNVHERLQRFLGRVMV